MPDTTTATPPPADGEQAKLDEPAKARTRYRVIWARMPGEDDDAAEFEFRYRELATATEATDDLGFYETTNADTAKRRAFADEAQAGHAALQRAAEEFGVVLRAIPASSWGLPVPPATRTQVKRETDWGF
jgi:hypothetical protein